MAAIKVEVATNPHCVERHIWKMTAGMNSELFSVKHDQANESDYAFWEKSLTIA